MRRLPLRVLVSLVVLGCLGLVAGGWPPVLASEAASVTIPIPPMPAAVLMLPATPATSAGVASLADTAGWTAGGVVSDTVGAVINQVTNITRNIIQFQFSTMMDAVVQMSASLVQRSYQAASEKFGDTLQTLIFGDYGIAPAAADPPLFRDLVAGHWQISLQLALLLLPATLALTTVSALRQGLASALGYAELREALLVWLVSAGAAIGSYYLTGLAYRVSIAAANGVAQANVGAPVTAQTLCNVLFNSVALGQIGASIAVNQPLLAMFLGFFILFLSCSLILGLGLALAAFTALTYLLCTLAPVVLVLGSLPPLRWLYQLWLKALTVVFLLPVADMLLLKAAVSLAAILLRGDGGWGTILAGLFASAGVLSVLITINFKVAEMTFGAIGEVARKAWDSTLGVTQMLVAAATFAVGGAALGAFSAPGAATGAVGAAAGGTAGTGGGGAAGAESLAGAGQGVADALNQPGLARQTQPAAEANAGQRAASTGQAAGPATTGGPANSNSAATPAQRPSAWQSGAGQARRAHMADRIGQMLARSRNPLLQGVGAGLQGVASMAGQQAGETQAAQQEAREQVREQRYEDGQQRQQAHDQQSTADRDQRELRYQEGQQRQQQRDQQSADERVLREQRYQEGLQQRQTERLERQQEQTRRDQERQASLARAARERSEASMVRWAERYAQKPDMGTPAEVLTPNYPITEVLGGVMLGAQQSRGFAMPLEVIRPVVESSYGRWRDTFEAQSGDAGIQIRREFFNVMADQNLVLNPDQLGAELVNLATRHQFTLGDDFAQAVDAMGDKYQWLT